MIINDDIVSSIVFNMGNNIMREREIGEINDDNLNK